MLTKVNKNGVRIIVMILIPVFLCIFVYCSIYIWFTNVSKWKYNIENFEAFREDFQAVSDFCLEHIEENSEIIYFTLSKNDIIYAGEKSGIQEIDASKDIINNFRNIELAFPDSDAKLDVIYCVDGAVYFTTNNNLYSVIYSPLSVPTTMSGRKTEANTKKITDDWYHAVNK